MKTVQICLTFSVNWQHNFIQFCLTKFFTCLFSREVILILIQIDQTSSIVSHFYFPQIPHCVAHCALFIWHLINRKNYVSKPKTMWFKCAMVTLPTSTNNMSSLHNALPRNSVQICWIFTIVSRVHDPARVISKFRMNNKNSSVLLLLNKDILN